MAGISNPEILQIIETVAKEKGLAKEEITKIVEQALQAAARGRYGNEENIKAKINRSTGEVKLYRFPPTISDNTESNNANFDADLESNLDNNSVDEIHGALSYILSGRSAAQNARQIITQGVNEIEREKQYHDFKSLEGEILTGTVKRVEGNIIVDLARTEAIIKKDQLIQNESYKVNDSIKAYVQAVRLEPKGPLVFLSRSDDQMLAKLFELEIPEIKEGVVEIKAIARDPGSKSKIAVFAADTSIDAIGSCVGIRGGRVKAVTSDLNGEKIDIVLWDKHIAQFVINAMAPVQILKIFIDEDKNRVEIVVPNEQLSLAIGRGGQNVRLASKLVGCRIDVMTEEQQSKKRSEEFTRLTTLFIESLDVEEMIAQLLVSEGYTSIEEIANSEERTLEAIEGFDLEIAFTIKERAQQYINDQNETIITALEKLGVEQELLDNLNLPPQDILKLAEAGIKSMEDLGEIKVREFKEIAPNSNLSDQEISALIKKGSISQ